MNNLKRLMRLVMTMEVVDIIIIIAVAALFSYAFVYAVVPALI